ncbi:MAG: hypothetical protein KGO53_13375 [Alphaproteobacteria bacterium]|nr:hypothetical protein [Alphaproteobacteria bacterium]
MPTLSLTFLFNVVLIVHAAKTGRFWPWAYVILFLPGLGGLAYLVVELAPEWLGSHRGRAARASLGATLNPGRRLRELQDNLDIADTIANREKLAEELLARGENQQALEHYRRILSLPGGRGQPQFVGQARAQIGLGDAKGALATLDDCASEFPDFKDSELRLLRAVALDMLGQDEAALSAYDAAAGSYAGIEPRVRRAALLARMGRGDEARSEAADIVKRLQRSPKFAQRAQAGWLAEAKRIAKS